MGVLEMLEPKSVFAYFEAISGIPRGSGHTERIQEYLKAFAEARALPVYTDEAGNTIIKKPGTKGRERISPVILQGHVDMVCAKRADVRHNFETDALDLGVDGDWIHANGTTLGGDDGIAVAMMLAILDSDTIPHPPLECVFTSDEETGLLGAEALDTSKLSGRTMINLDSEEEGIFTCGCAGGCRVDSHLPIRRITQRGLPVVVTFTGLRGGHSGGEIDKMRANADKLAGRYLYELSRAGEFSLAGVSGGDKDNAIPPEARIQLVIDEDDFRDLVVFTEDFEKTIRKEYAKTDPGIRIRTEKGSVHRVSVLDTESQDRVIAFLQLVPFGVRKMSPDIGDLVETSLNLGIVRTGEAEFAATSSVRSSVPSEKAELVSEIRCLTEYLNGSIQVRGDYPAWEFRDTSALRDLMEETYEELFDKEALVSVIHAGLECGLFYEKMPGLDAVSIGPDMKDIHTSEERLSVSSTARTYAFLLEILKKWK